MNYKIAFNMVTISFFLRSNNDKIKSHVLYCRVSLNGSICEFSLKEKIDKVFWNQKNQSYSSKDKNQNKLIESMMDAVRFRIKKKAIYTDEQITAKELINSLSEKPTKAIKLIDVVRKYIDACESSSGTIRNHEIKYKNLLKFSKATKTEYSPECFSLLVCSEFIDWFTLQARTKNITTANRNVLFFKMCCKWYQKKGNSLKSELLQFDGSKDKLQSPVYLTSDELETVRTTLFSSEYLTRIKDLFIFQCYTGLSYCDLWSEWEIKTETFGTVITGNRGKNGQSFWLPIENDIVLRLLAKYENQMPRYANETYNRMLKEIALICNIDKRITTHTARKTFATMMDANGWSRETVSKMLGHSSVKTTELYYLGQSFARLENEFRERKKA